MRSKRRTASAYAFVTFILLFSLPQFSSAVDRRPGLYGDPCSVNADCHFPDSVCHDVVKICKCRIDVPVSNYLDKCGKPASINETCMFNEQCEDVDFKTECKNDRCACKYEMVPAVMIDNISTCVPPNPRTLEDLRGGTSHIRIDYKLTLFYIFIYSFAVLKFSISI